MKIFYQQYHISVDECFVDDCLAIGHEVVMPSNDMAAGRIDFFRSNDEHADKSGVQIVDFDTFLTLPPMALVIPCCQLYVDMMKLYEARGKVDTLVFFASLAYTSNVYPLDGADFVIAHDVDFYDRTTAKHKIMYFNRPRVTPKEKDLRRAFEQKQINLFINNFNQPMYEQEHAHALAFRDAWGHVPFYGYGMADGYPDMQGVHDRMHDAMFTLVFKRIETWGQMVNESMLIGTPCVFLRQFINNAFTRYLINPSTAVIGDTVDDLVAQIKALTFEQYETLCMEARAQSQMFTNAENRRAKLAWLFSKVPQTS